MRPFPEPRTAATKALDNDESLPEAHAALAVVQSQLDWDWAGAERGFERALELNPNSADAHSEYSAYLSAMRQFEEAIAHAMRVAELDPLSPERRHRIGCVYFMARQYDQALEVYREMLEFDPSLGNPRGPDSHFMFGWIYREKGMYEEAIAEFREALKKEPGAAYIVAHLGNAYAERAGWRSSGVPSTAEAAIGCRDGWTYSIARFTRGWVKKIRPSNGWRKPTKCAIGG